MNGSRQFTDERLSGEEWLAKGDDFRINQYEAYKAIECYKRALNSGDLVRPSRQRYAQQMIGVCYNMLHDSQKAKEWFNKALTGSQGVVRAKIWRDMGYSYTLAGRYDNAEKCLQQSMDLLSYGENPVEIGATTGFMAINLSRQGLYEDAMVDFSIADDLLMHHDKRLALYNCLDWAETLSRAGHGIQARTLALKCYFMAKEYGSKAHRYRALALITGGWRLEQLVGKRRQKQLQTLTP